MGETIGIGIVGAGIIGKAHARVFTEDPRTRVVGVCDLAEERARQLARECGAGTAATGSLRDLLDLPGLSAVSIATPDFDHLTPALAATAAGKHLLCEKPLATTVEDATSILQSAQRAGVSLMIDFQNRFNPAFLQAKEAIASGEIGPVQLMHLRLSDAIYVPTKMLSWAEEGSVAWFLGSHCVDIVRWLTGREVERVYAVSRARVLRQRGVDTADFFHMTLELDDGCVATIENCWILSDNAPAIVDFHAEIVGAEGHIKVQPIPHGMVTVASAAGYRSPDVLGGHETYGRMTGFANESVRHFISHLATGQPLAVTGQDGLEATRVICAAEESARAGVPVRILPCSAVG